MPAALYPGNVTLEFLSVGGKRSTVTRAQEIKMPLLCWDCEQRFSHRGESEVLRYVAAKIAAKKPIPLIEKLSPLPQQEGSDHTLTSYCGTDAGLDMDKFAYFALSVAWRSTHPWPIHGEPPTKPLTLGWYKEPIRAFLAAETPEFPKDTAVIVLVGTDKLSRETWFLPTQCDAIWFHDIRFLAFGVLFRVLIGRSLPDVYKIDSCHADGKRIHVGDMSTKTQQALTFMEQRDS